MGSRLFHLPNRPSGQVGLLLALCFVLFFVNLGQWDLWNPDEPRYAQVAREMVHRGDWILMHFNGERYGDKPPLFFWLIALSSFLWNGFTSFSVRFPSAFFATLTVLLTFLLGRRLFSTRTGFISGLVLATSLEFAYLATRANIDATLTFFTTAAFFCFVKWHWEMTPPSQGERGDPMGPSFRQNQREGEGSLLIFGFYIAMALATLTKGPVGFILPLLVSLAYLAVRRDWDGIKRMRLLPGMILFLLIVFAWYGPALLKGGKEYFNETILLHTVDRFAKGSSHIRPFYYYLYNFPADFLPWIFFLPGALAHGLSTRKEGLKREFLFLLVWFAVIFLFFSLSKGKRGLYLLPLFPAVSLMVGKFWEDYISGSVRNLHPRWFTIPFHILLGLLLGLGVGVLYVVSTKFDSYLYHSLPVGFLFIGGSLALFLLCRFGKRLALLLLIVGIMGGTIFYTQSVIFPALNPFKSARFISEEVTSRIRPGEKLAVYGIPVIAPYSYYTGIVPILELHKREDLLRLFQSTERVFCLLKYREFAQMQGKEGMPEMKVIARRKVGGDDVVLVSNR
ncbi:MAG: glycosyltransferase family 39 protein [Desulfobacterota bacterium]|nr:glycosyltransferase family 39 protein [Thermodesulfobacteriota bacterium]